MPNKRQTRGHKENSLQKGPSRQVSFETFDQNDEDQPKENDNNDDNDDGSKRQLGVDVARRVFRPGVTATQLRLQPGFVLLPSVWNEISTVLVLVTMTGGWK